MSREIQIGTTVQTYCHKFADKAFKTAKVIGVVVDEMTGEVTVQMRTGGSDRFDVTPAFFQRAYVDQRRAV